MDKIKVFVVDDHAIILDGITAMFMGTEIEIAATFMEGSALLARLKQQQPNLVLLDIALPGLTGIELCKLIAEQYPSISVLMVSAKTDEHSITGSLKSGAKGFLSKNASKDEIEKAIKWVNSGKMYFGEGINDTIFRAYVKGLTSGNLTSQKSTLTDREVEIVKLFSDGLLYKEIAYKLSISIKTVEAHKSNIMKKIEAKSTAELVKYAIREGIACLD